MTMAGAPRLHLAVDAGLQEVDAGGAAVFMLTITNLGDEPQAQSLSLEGLPNDWLRLEFDEERQAYPGEQRSAVLTVSVPPDVASGPRRFRIVAAAGDERSVADCVLQLRGVDPEPSAAAASAAEAGRTIAPGLALDRPDIAIEAGSEQRSTLRVTLRNVSDRESEYSLALQGLEPTWFRLPARLRVPAGASIDTELEVQPLSTATSGVHPFTIWASLSDDVTARAEVRGELTVLARSAAPAASEPAPSQERASAAAAAVPPEVVLGPETTFRFAAGEMIEQATISVHNRGRLLEGYSVEVVGLPSEWFRLPIREVRLEPGASGEVMLRLTPRPGGEHPAGDYPFRVRVTPHGAPDAFSEVGGVLSVAGVSAFDARVSPQQAQGRRESYKVTLRNTGTERVSLWIEGSDPEGACRFDYPPPPNLEPGEERVLPVRVGVRRNRFVGSPRAFDFTLRALPAGAESSAARTFNARLVHQPYLGQRVLKWSLIGAALAVVAGIALRIGPSRLGDGTEWLRCRIDSSPEYCTEAVAANLGDYGLDAPAITWSEPVRAFGDEHTL